MNFFVPVNFDKRGYNVVIFALSISLLNRPTSLEISGKQRTDRNGLRRCNKSGNEHLCCNPYSIAVRQANLKN